MKVSVVFRTTVKILNSKCFLTPFSQTSSYNFLFSRELIKLNQSRLNISKSDQKWFVTRTLKLKQTNFVLKLLRHLKVVPSKTMGWPDDRTVVQIILDLIVAKKMASQKRLSFHFFDRWFSHFFRHFSCLRSVYIFG